MTASANASIDDPVEIEDTVERMLKKTGCMELHYQVQVRTFIIILNRLHYQLIVVLEYNKKLFFFSIYFSFK